MCLTVMLYRACSMFRCMRRLSAGLNELDFLEFLSRHRSVFPQTEVLALWTEQKAVPGSSLGCSLVLGHIR